MAKMRAVQIAYTSGPFEPVERDIPEPDQGRCASKSRPADIVCPRRHLPEDTLPYRARRTMIAPVMLISCWARRPVQESRIMRSSKWSEDCFVPRFGVANSASSIANCT
jgi:hypothetical protein